TPTAHTFYMVFAPPNVTVDPQNPAYHSYYQPATGLPVVYGASIYYDDMGGQTSAFSHELTEAITDPITNAPPVANGWWYTDTGNAWLLSEIADVADAA